MKRLFFLACTVMIAVAAPAQLTWNAKLGAGFASCAGDINDDGNVKLHFVGKAGVGIEYPLSDNLSLMPSLEFAVKGTKYDEKKFSYNRVFDLYYAQIPVMAAYRLNLNDDWNLTLKAGPYFAYGITGSFEWEEDDYSVSGDLFDHMNRFDAGIDVGIDFERHRFVFGLEFERGFTNMSKGGDASCFNQAFYATVGYKF